jgi:hypothetical protein
MPQFSLKRLLASMTAIAIGISSIVYLVRGNVADSADNLVLAFALWFGGGMLIGGGLFAPFKRAVVGAILGLAVQLAIGMCLKSARDG